MLNVVTIGGGTGHLTLLRGLKSYNIKLNAIVSVADNGGNSGKIREELVDFGILPPGDIRNCLLALTNESELNDTVKLFEYRFPDTSGGLAKQNLGNLIITAAQHSHGNIQGINKVAKMLGIRNANVIPISPDPLNLYAETESGKLLKGQIEVSYPEKNEKISKIALKPSAFASKEAVNAIKRADAVIICPGDLYGSILPNFLVKGIREALKNKSKIIYVCNLVTKQGTHEFNAKDFVKIIERYIGRELDHIVCNTKEPTKDVVDKYKYENSAFVEPDLENSKVVKDNLLEEHCIGNKIVVRHNARKTARIIMALINE